MIPSDFSANPFKHLLNLCDRCGWRYQRSLRRRWRWWWGGQKKGTSATTPTDVMGDGFSCAKNATHKRKSIYMVCVCVCVCVRARVFNEKPSHRERDATVVGVAHRLRGFPFSPGKGKKERREGGICRLNSTEFKFDSVSKTRPTYQCQGNLNAGGHLSLSF